ncbi:siderophore synthetase component [Kitasatospora sp. MAP12-44]|uniref:IucA/IucC family protein n=1 Tax=Kitasatospora sp. MAP12-44 TaxID=3035099 RepID=UPI002476EA78|nr:IucA/IucC family protein [Kitasatospora sp. MAP12-44]MDH6115259.1 siderophore synthetase component [Kitasatospora sp. MAP12-44]
MSELPQVPGDQSGALLAARASILDRLVSALVREGLVEAAALGVPVRTVNLAGKHRVDGPGPDPVDLLDGLLARGVLPPEGDWGLLRAETAAGVEGYALALEEAARQAEKLRAIGPWQEQRPFSELLERLATHSPLVGFEQLALDGHPLHPSARSRRGMSAAELTRYAPEFGAVFPLRFVAVRRDAASGADGTGHGDPMDPAAGLAAVDRVLAEAFPGAVAQARAELVAAGLPPGDFVLVPVHPHQFEHALPELHGDALAAGVVVPLAATVQAMPLLSTRTLAAREPGVPGLHVKTALEVQLTTAVRGVSPEAAHNGPRLSILLAAIAEQDAAVRRLGVAREYAGVVFQPRRQDAARRRSLGAVLREDVELTLAPDEVALPMAALLARSPLTGLALVHDLLVETGLTPQDWLRGCLGTLVEPLLTLLVRYGVAMEAHAQNTVLVLRGGSPCRAVVRDFGSLRILPARLARSGHTVTLLPGSALYARDAGELRRKLFFPLFGNQLAELVPALAQAGGCAEERLWEVVREAVVGALGRLAQTEAEAVDEARALLADRWQLKALVRMRLGGKVTEAIHVDAPNPLGEPLNALEDGVLEQLRVLDPQLAVEWLGQLPAARRDTRHDLRAALLREGVDLPSFDQSSLDQSSLDPSSQPGGEAAEEFRTELADSAANRALARALVARRAARLSGPDLLSSLHGAPSTVALQLEALNAEGHPLHPCRRTRRGFSTADVLAYTPESGAVVGVQLAAVRRELLLESPGERGSVGELLAAGYPQIAAQAERGLRARGVDPAQYALVPVHPWQARERIPALYASELAEGALVLLPEAVLPCRPTASIRSLVTVDPGRDGRRYAVKVSLDIQLTGLRRTISPATTRNSPQIAGVIDRLLAAEPRLRGRAVFVPELAGVAFAPPETTPAEAGSGDPARLRGLCALVRPDPADQLHPGESAVSGCALLAHSPFSGGTLLTELVDRSARSTGVPLASAAREFLREYAELLCSAVLPLLARCGIALEAHLQNTILAVDPDGRPARLLLRDSAGLRLHPGRLAAAGVDFTPYPGSVTVSPDLDVVRAKISHAVIQGNLGVLVNHLSAHYGLPAPRTVGDRTGGGPRRPGRRRRGSDGRAARRDRAGHRRAAGADAAGEGVRADATAPEAGGRVRPPPQSAPPPSTYGR